ncbi:hypothetical protein [Serratia quinivorans]|uniref:hypothetical protein n=1 Tax=Serratia quinivorans TaxID=137545 RepID=UPI0021BAE726|nr:hypothetical protein [Serratia quinivorans]
MHNNASQFCRQRPGRRALAVTAADFSRYAGNHCMADRFTDDTQQVVWLAIPAISPSGETRAWRATLPTE